LEKEISIILQARMGSKRFPGKMGKLFYKNKLLIEILIERLISFIEPSRIILATSINQADDLFVTISQKYAIKIFRGDENNVLKRFIDAATFFKTDKILRICADNPFLQTFYLNKIYEEFLIFNGDYISFFINDKKPSILTHSGFFAEGMKRSSLEKIIIETNESIYYEHVSNYFYSFPDKFEIKWIPVFDEFFEKVRLTIDTEADFKLAQSLYEMSYPLIDIESLKRLLIRNPLYLELMKKSIKINEK
jgi:spore coat polysaccharide biosynthesis protein SpsF